MLLPEDAEFKPTGESPLARNEAFVRAPCPQCGGEGRRETDTMDTFFDSSWYFLRYLSAKNATEPWGPGQADAWAPVDQYTGGAEHAVMHLMYARFFTKALRDIGLLNFGEPFLRLYNQGHIIADGAKMSKSRGNVVAPDVVRIDAGRGHRADVSHVRRAVGPRRRLERRRHQRHRSVVQPRVGHLGPEPVGDECR